MDPLVVLPVVVPLGAAAVLAGVGRLLPRRAVDAVTIATAAATAGLCLALLHDAAAHDAVHWFGGWTPRHGIAIGVDLLATPMGTGLAAFVSLLATVAAVYSWGYLEEDERLYHPLLLVFSAAMVGFCLAGDLFDMFVLFELMSVAAYGLTAYKTDEPGPLEGSFNFAVSNSIGAFLVLFGIGLLYGRTHALNLSQLGVALAGRRADALAICAFTLVVAGFLVKAATVPFHFWLADAHAVAPAPVCLLFSGVMVELGLFGVAQVYWQVFSGVLDATAALRAVLVGFGALTAAVGAVMCLSQHHLKRLLALSTVSHAGLVLIGIGLLGARGLAGAAVYVVGHGLVKGALFLSAGVILHRTGKVDDHHLHGRCRDLPFTAVLWTVGGLALAGLPPFATYLGKGMLDEAAHADGLTWVAVVGLLASAVTGGAVLRAGGHMFLGWGPVDEGDATSERQGAEEHREDEGSPSRTPLVLVGPVVALLLGAVAVGLVPGLTARVESAADRFVDRAATAQLVLHGAAPVRVAGVASHGPTGSMVLFGLLGALGAVAVAAAALGRERIPSTIAAPVRRVVMPAQQALRAAHSGHVGDYVAWLTFGTAALGAAVTLAVHH